METIVITQGAVAPCHPVTQGIRRFLPVVGAYRCGRKRGGKHGGKFNARSTLGKGTPLVGADAAVCLCSCATGVVEPLMTVRPTTVGLDLRGVCHQGCIRYGYCRD